MVGRPFWSGQLKVSFVSFGIQLYPAVNPSVGVTFYQVDRKTGGVSIIVMLSIGTSRSTAPRS